MVQIGQRKAVWLLRPPLIRASKNLDAMESYSSSDRESEEENPR